MLRTGFDPAFGIYRGDVTVTGFDAQGKQTSSTTLHNPTPQDVTKAYLKAAGLMQYIVGEMKASGNGLTFQFDQAHRAEVLAILNNTKIFSSSNRSWFNFGQMHKGEVGGPPFTDYRSIMGTLGPRSLQVVINGTTLKAFADTDRFNPYQDLRGFFGHAFLEVMPGRLRRLFR